MRKQVFSCDKCGATMEIPSHVFTLFKERKSNGMESENYDWVSDLCSKCTSLLAKRLEKVLSALPNDELKREIATLFNCRVE